MSLFFDILLFFCSVFMVWKMPEMFSYIVWRKNQRILDQIEENSENTVVSNKSYISYLNNDCKKVVSYEFDILQEEKLSISWSVEEDNSRELNILSVPLYLSKRQRERLLDISKELIIMRKLEGRV